MSTVETYYRGLTRQGNVHLQVETTTATFSAYIGITATAEELTSTYYKFSLVRDNRFNSTDYPTQFFSDIETALGITLRDGDLFIATPVQNGLNKQQKQVQKLDIAAKTRTADGNARATYDLTQLPTNYSTNAISDNANSGGLVVGRPWTSISYSAGLYRSQYSSWPNQNTANPTWFDGKTAVATTVATNFDLTLTAGETSRGYQWLGYILPDFTGTWTFSTNGASIDDSLIVWIGGAALSGYTTSNDVLEVSVAAGSNTVSLTAGTYYPIRVQYANNGGPGSCTLWWSRNGSSLSKTWTGKLFYNSATNGF